MALGFGASLISIFARLGGGIFTKGADVGGDLVGKVEAGIPEDDPRNPATIADNVGDNVGDCAGMAADLFETYAVTLVATMVLAAIFFSGQTDVGGRNVLETMLLYPMAIGAACIVTSIIGTFFVRLGSNQSIMGALYKGLIGAAHSRSWRSPVSTWSCSAASRPASPRRAARASPRSAFPLRGGRPRHHGADRRHHRVLHRTGYRPVKSIAHASVTGHGTNVIQALAISLESTALPAIVIVAGIIVTYGSPACSASPSRSPPCWRWPASSSPSTLRAGHRQCRRHRR